MIVFGHYSSEVYRAKGKPRLSFLAQMLHLVVLVPTCVISLRYGFWVLVYARAFIRIQFILVHLGIMGCIVKFPIKRIFPNIKKPLLFALLMGGLALGLQQISPNTVWSLFSIGVCALAYFGLMWFFAKNDVQLIMNLLLKRQSGVG